MINNDSKTSDTWQFIAHRWPDQWFQDSKRERDELIKNIETHNEHSKTETCKGCGISFCYCLRDYICKTENVCHLCDEIIQPYLFNPKNRNHIVKYLPSKMYLIYSFE